MSISGLLFSNGGTGGGRGTREVDVLTCKVVSHQVSAVGNEQDVSCQL